MSDNPAVPGAFRVEVIGEMTIEWDVPIEVSDGAVLRAGIFRPTAPGVPVSPGRRRSRPGPPSRWAAGRRK
jgi:hypothetical protein